MRNRGTIGGSLAHADPGADYPAAILALDAEIIAANTSGTRTIPARDFFVDMLTTQLHPGEILTQIRIAPRRRYPARLTRSCISRLRASPSSA